ncbi:MAG TPA: FAD-binding oxidoreductase, partial [Rhodospirillales bacterium]|nr:FAD-binding oxidoreductase [Rhodospirillales bacterium]
HTYGRFRGQWNKAEYDATARSLDDLRKIAPLNLEMISQERQRHEIGTEFYSGGLLLHDHGGLHPGKYTAGLIAAAGRAGATFCGNTIVTNVAPSGSGFQVTTSRGNIRAGSVLMATNGYTTNDFSWLKRRIFPPVVNMIVTEELSPEIVEDLMPGKRMIVETRARHCYYRLSPDGKRLMIGGRVGLTPIPYDRAARILRNLMVEIFPRLKSVKISHCWNGQTGFSFSYLAHLGQHNGIWHALGYSGSGNGMAPYLGHKAALNMLALAGGETNFTKTKLETKSWYQGWPWFLPIAQSLFRLKDIKENMARGK